MFNYVHFTHMYICKALCQHMRTSLLLLCPIWFESAIFKLIAYPRSKVKEVKELLFRCHLRLIKLGAETDENPRHSQFLSPFLIFHSSKASPVARWLISKKWWQKCLTNYWSVWYFPLHPLPVLTSVIECCNISLQLMKICILRDSIVENMIWMKHQLCGLIRSAVGFSSEKKWMPKFFLSQNAKVFSSQKK